MKFYNSFIKSIAMVLAMFVFIIPSIGISKTVEATDGSTTRAPLLHVGYIPESGTSIDISVTTSSDDAEETAEGGMESLYSSDLELVEESSTQTVGIRFQYIPIPQNAEIISATIQFQADESHSGITNLTIKGQDTDNAPTFISSAYNISSRTTTSASVSWPSIPSWSRGDNGAAQQTPELTSIVQEIVNRGGWQSGNAMAFIVTGSGKRVAESYDGNGTPPLLHIEYIGEGGAQTASIGDFVWVDTDEDGVQDGSESGLANVTVNLYHSNGSSARTTSTNGSGNYSFNYLSPGDYYIDFILPTGYIFSPQDQTFDNYDSDVNTITGRTITMTLNDGDNDVAWDAGLINQSAAGTQHPNSEYLYAVADDANILVYSPRNGSDSATEIGPVGASSIEALAISLDGETLFAAASGTFGTLNWNTGAFNAIGNFGVGNGSEGSVEFDDVDGLAFDPLSGILYGTHRWNDGSPEDILFQIEPSTGSYISDAFGLGHDYIVVQTYSAVGLYDIDDIALDPADGQMYAVVNTRGGSDRIVMVDKTNGVVTDVGRLHTLDGNLDDIEGLSFHNSGIFYGTTGNGGSSSTENTIWQINTFTALCMKVHSMDLSGDYEGVVGYISGTTSIGDLVWNDLDKDGIYDEGEPGIEGVTAQLYRGNGTFVTSTTTNASGLYLFSGLMLDEYYVKFFPPSGFVFTQQNQGSNNTLDSDADSFSGQTAVTMLSDNENDMTWDAGMYQAFASLGDYVWLDTDKDGIQEVSESGLENITVNLYHSNGILAGTTTTSSIGYYSLGNVPGDYYLEFILPTGYAFSPQNNTNNDNYDSNANTLTGRSVVTTLSSGENDATWDAGMYQVLASIGDYVWLDTDKDGVQDGNETGIENITVKLYYSNGSLAGSTTTNASGYYSFMNLTPDDYYLDYILPTGYVFSPQNQTSDNYDSDANISTGQTIIATLSSGDNDVSWDAGMYQELASIGDIVWLDTDKDGIQDGSEIGMGGVTVQLYYSGGTLAGSTTTNGSGNYSFAGLASGNYYVKFLLPSGYYFSPQDQTSDNYDSDANISTGQTATITLSVGENDVNWDAGINNVYASVGDYVWLDTDGDGVQDFSENGLPNVTVNLYHNGGGLAGSTTTNTSGYYNFTNLTPGDYYLGFTLISGHEFSAQNQGSNNSLDSDANPSNGQTTVISLSTGESNTTLDAGMFEPAQIGDYVWNDANQDGLQNDGSAGIENILMKLYNQSWVEVGATLTNSNGWYEFSGLSAGTYIVDVDDSNFLPGGLLQGWGASPVNVGDNDAIDSDGGQETITLDNSENIQTADFGYYEQTECHNPTYGNVEIDGIYTEWDITNDFFVPMYRAGKPNKDILSNLYLRYDSYEGILYALVLAVGDPVNATGGANDDHFVKLGNKIKLIDANSAPPDGTQPEFAWIGLNGDTALGWEASMYLAENEYDNLNVHTQIIGDETSAVAYRAIGLCLADVPSPLASIGDYVWIDVDGDGIQDGEESGMANVTVNLYHSGGSAAGNTTTNSTGYYSFTYLELGDYYLDFILPNGYAFSPQDQGGDDNKDSDANPSTGQTIITTLSSGESDLTWAAGMYQEFASIGDYVWFDVDGDGIQDEEENGLANVDINLYHSGGSVAGNTTSNASGYYNFTYLTPGDYYLNFTLPDGYAFSPQNQGGDDNKDSDVNISTGQTNVTTLGVGGNDFTQDAGMFQELAAVGDIVWNDTNQNGIQDGGEGGISSVTVYLYDSANNVVCSLTTNENGHFSFTDLIPGDYYIEFILPDGYTFSPQNQGVNDANDSDANPSNGQTEIITLSSGENDITVAAGMYEITDACPNCLIENPGFEEGFENWTAGNGAIITTDSYAGESAAEMSTTDSYIVQQINGSPDRTYYLFVRAKATNDVSSATIALQFEDASNNLLHEELVSVTNSYYSLYTIIFTAPEYTQFINLLGNKEGANGSCIIDEICLTEAHMYDFGDLPDGPYKSTLENNGPRHLIDEVTYLGAISPDGENNAPHNAFALGDDNDGYDDEDGVTFITPLIPGSTDALILVEASTVGYLNAWVDFNDDGDFDDIYEQIASDKLLTAGINQLTISQVPTTARGAIKSRFRFTSGSGQATSPYGSAPNGEVEDYALASIGNFVWNDITYNGIQSDGEELGLNGIVIQLFDGNGEFLVMTSSTNHPTTGAPGWYEFSGILPGTYHLQFHLPGGYIFSPQDRGNDNMDSDANPSTGKTAQFTLAEGQVNNSMDAGFMKLSEVDFGDLPDGPYPTYMANDGARHVIGGNLFLGLTAPDAETNGQSNSSASGDDADGIDDEDGVTFLSPLHPGRPAIIEVIASAIGYLNAWIDFNGDGDFDDDNEQIATNLTVNAGVNMIAIAEVPNNAKGVTASRFRLSSAAGISYTGQASDGEVEDYILGSIGDFVWVDSNGNGLQDVGEAGKNLVTVKLLDINGAPVLDAADNPITTSTRNHPISGEQGWYVFSGLLPGGYMVEFVLPSGYSFSPGKQGNDDNVDSDVDISTGLAAIITIEAGDYNKNVDAGLMLEAQGNISGDPIDGFTLNAAYPNPFNPVTTIEYGLESAGEVHMAIYDIAGRLINTLVNEQQESGWHRIQWNGLMENGSPVSAGVYLCVVRSGNYTRNIKLILVK